MGHCQGMVYERIEAWEEEVTKGHEKLLEVMDMSHYLHCGDGCTSVYMSQCTKMYTSDVCRICQLYSTKP